MSGDLSVSPAAVGISCAALGAGLGYVSAPEKYTLKQLLTQEPEVFERIIPDKILQKASGKQKTAYSSITDARKTVTKALKNNKADEKVTELLKSEDMQTAFRQMKKLIPKARVQAMVIGGVIAGMFGALLKMIFSNSKPSIGS